MTIETTSRSHSLEISKSFIRSGMKVTNMVEINERIMLNEEERVKSEFIIKGRSKSICFVKFSHHFFLSRYQEQFSFVNLLSYKIV